MIRSLYTYRALAMVALLALVSGCSGGGNSSPTPATTATPTSGGGTSTIGGGSGSGGGTSTNAFACPSNDSTSSVAQTQANSARRGAIRNMLPASSAAGLVAVTYAGALSANAKTLAATREAAAGANLVSEMTFSHIGRYQRILHVTPGTEAHMLAILRAAPGVIDATVTGTPRMQQTVSQKYYTNDPDYNGFTTAQVAAAGSANATYHVDPYEESERVPGQWGMHAVRLDYAQAYSQTNNGSNIVNAGALGSSNVKIAVIDSGADTNHPELASKIAYQKCFITSGMTQSVSSYSQDPDGHGTDVSGIAADAINNSLGYVGTGGGAVVYAYRIFPTPDDSCLPGYSGTVSAQCYSDTVDIASAINDAVAQHVNVINLSLGGGDQASVCSNGRDPDSTEGAAIANAIAANIVVVAAAGNAAANSPAVVGVGAPACDSGVIAVGASALSDGVVNGTSTSPSGSASAQTEYVAGYSQYGSPAASADNSSAWGIVAPGGDPSTADEKSTSTDLFHWIQNIWTTTPVDYKYQGDCNADFGSLAGSPADCAILVAGTSQASPMVAGAAALIIAANSSYQSPSRMKQLLCSTAHDIGDAHEGCGRLDIYRAMATAVGDGNLPASR